MPTIDTTNSKQNNQQLPLNDIGTGGRIFVFSSDRRINNLIITLPESGDRIETIANLADLFATRHETAVRRRENHQPTVYLIAAGIAYVAYRVFQAWREIH